MKTSLGLRMGQSLAMTPALQQAIRLLQLSSLDLQQEIQNALDANVLLEQDDTEPATDTPDLTEPEIPREDDAGQQEVTVDTDLTDELPVDADWSEVYSDHVASKSSVDEDYQDFLQANLHKSVSLHEHLHEQARLSPFGDTGALIAEHIIDEINDDGYLEHWPELLQRLGGELGIQSALIEEVLRLIQDFDPPGVGARDLAECLRLQLQQLKPTTLGRKAALQLVNEHLTLLARRDPVAIAKASDLPPEIVIEAMALIRTLQPHPGRPFQAHESDYIAPDVHVSKQRGRWRATINTEHSPKLRINSTYQGMIKRADTSRDQLMLKQHLQEARYFINSLEARNETLLRVAQCIVEEQRAFLEYGDEAMRPLVLRDVSEQLGIHESTVSRATANKYMLTPRGLYELKHFFSSHVQTTQGGVCSATAIQAMIKRLITTEDPSKPLSDATLSELLLKEGIQVARRTIAKYREGLNIPPSHERKPSLA